MNPPRRICRKSSIHLSPGLLEDALELRNHLIRRLVVLPSRSSHRRFPGALDLSALHVSLGKLSQISGADSAVPPTSVHVRPRKVIAKSREHSFEYILHMSSLQVQKRHCARWVRVRHADSATGGVCWIPILLLGYSILDLRTVCCTSLGDPRPMA